MEKMTEDAVNIEVVKLRKFDDSYDVSRDVQLTCDTITRVEVIERGVGRLYVNTNTKLECIQLQDGRRTLKIFIEGC